jgi:hypothetical protein
MPWPGRRRWVPPPPSPVEVRPGETILLIGKPGTGKSTLAEWMVREASSCIVYDTKNDPDEQAKWVSAGFTAVEDPAELDHHARALMVCDPAWTWGTDSHRDRAHPWSRALDHPFHRVPTALVFDEVLNVFPVGGGHPGTLKLLHQGRSRGHVLIAGSQMATGIDTRLIQLAHHIVALGVLEGQQMRHLATATGSPAGRLGMLAHRQIGWRPAGGQWRLFHAIDRDGRHLSDLWPLGTHSRAPFRLLAA